MPEASVTPRPTTDPLERMVIWELAGAVPRTVGLFALVIRSVALMPVSGSIPETLSTLVGFVPVGVVPPLPGPVGLPVEPSPPLLGTLTGPGL